MTEMEISRLETKLNDMDQKLDHCQGHLAGLAQWKNDQEKRRDEQAIFCRGQDGRLHGLETDLHQEKVDRTREVGKLWTAVGKKLTTRAMVAAFLGSLLPGLAILFKVLSEKGVE